jgi:hypothetical protein
MERIRIAVETPDARVGIVVQTREAVMNTLAGEGMSFEIVTQNGLSVVRVLGPVGQRQPRLRPLRDAVPVLARSVARW